MQLRFPSFRSRQRVNNSDTEAAMGGGTGDPPLIPSSSASVPPSAPTHEVHQVYENQRWLALAGWQPPVALLDAPAWSDNECNQVTLVSPPSLDSPEWEVVISPSTDGEGWQYATVFKHLQYKRAGGRASQRFGDTTRRRMWRRRDNAVVGEAVDPSVTAEAAAVAAARNLEAKNKAIRGFVSMILDLLSRRNVWTLVPWDPSALYFLSKSHKEIYQQLQTQARQRQLFSADTDPPSSILHPDGSGTMLQDLLCAALHSRAAYGFAMAAGHIDSVSSYIKLHTVQPLSFNAVSGVSVEANNEAVAALAGIAPEDILLSDWNNSPFRPCHYVAIDRVNRCIVVSVRGTLEMGDLLSDLTASPMEVSIGGTAGYCHPGILSAASYIHCRTESALKKAAKQCPGWPVLLTGHSLGGGVAALLCMLLRERGGLQGLGPIHAITIGSAAVMSEELAAACEDTVISVVLGSDLIPHLSYASVERLLVEASEASPVRRVAEGLKKKLDGVLTLTRMVTGEFNGASTSTSTGKGMEEGAREVPVVVERQVESGSAASDAAPEKERGSAGGDVNHTTQNVDTAEASFDGVKEIRVIDLSGSSGGPAAPKNDSNKQTSILDKKKKLAKNTSSATSISLAQAGVLDEALPPPPTVLEYASFGGGDVPLATTGMAAQAAAASEARSSHDFPQSHGIITEMDTNHKNGQDQLPGDPALLFPPGRLLWIFPADEDVSTNIGEQPGAGSGINGGVGGSGDVGAGDLGSGDGNGVTENELEAAWDSAWEESLLKFRPTSPTAAEKNEDAQAARQQTADHAALTDQKGPPGVHASAGAGAVNIDEAAEQVAAQGGVSSTPAADDGFNKNKTGGGAVSVPTVVEADRSAFERLLLMPDGMNDHLPHRYLETLQKL